MADQVKTFNNTIRTGGLLITEGSPVDDRLQVMEESFILDAFSTPFTDAEITFTGTLYDGMVVQSTLTKREYVWTESTAGLLGSTGYTYPSFDPYYRGRTFNFVLYDASITLDITYTNQAIAGFFITDDVLPFKVLKNKDSVVVTLKSSESVFTELELPDLVQTVAGGIEVLLDPAPVVGEQFKITIS